MTYNLNLRETYGRTLADLGKADKQIAVLDADLSKSTMSRYFEEKFPERFFEIGIAEQNMISIGSGLALTGKTVFINTFAVFLTGRAYDQIRVGAALPRSNIKLVGSSSGLSDYDDGATHQSIEDVSLMRSLPNMMVLVPSDSIEIKKMTEYISRYNGPVYMRVTRGDQPLVFDPDWDFEPGRLYEMKKGRDAVIFTNGTMVNRSLNAAAALKNQNLDVGVVNVSTVKPLNREELASIASQSKKIVVAEEHNVIGGLGSAVLEALSMVKGLSIRLLGINDMFGRSACSAEELIDFYGLSEKSIMDAVKETVREN